MNIEPRQFELEYGEPLKNYYNQATRKLFIDESYVFYLEASLADARRMEATLDESARILGDELKKRTIGTQI